MKCRHCKNQLQYVFLDLGFAPPSNAYLSLDGLNAPELHFPLKLLVCEQCWLVQTEDYANADELFTNDYAYFSSISKSWLNHSLSYFKLVWKRFSLNSNSYVIEVASNDGYLLKNFVESKIPCLGIEPTISTSKSAKKLGINVLQEFFSYDMAKKLVIDNKKADLIIGNNVYAHVPDINDFTKGLKKLLKKDGVITLEFAYILTLIDENQFDTIYHEHFSYLSLSTVQSIFNKVDLKIFDVEELSTHGGSLRIYGCHKTDIREISKNVNNQLLKEESFGLKSLDKYSNFQIITNKIKNDLNNFLIDAKIKNKLVVGYGAAAKGNTLINYSGIKPDLLPFICDASLSKQYMYSPGSHIPIYPPEFIIKNKPDYVLILPWNISKEIMDQLSYIKDWGGKFVKAIPELTIIK